MNYGVKMSYVTTGSITLLILLMFIPNQMLFSQSSEELSSSPALKETIKIVNPITTQNVSTGKELIISGQSSDNTLKNCSVSLIVNDVRPYQYAVASGAGGISDFSQWKFVLHTNYTHIIEGENKITAKLLCTSAPTRWYSVFVNGVPNYSNEDVLSPVQSEVRQDIPTTNLSAIKDKASNNNSVMLVSISSQKNPVTRGDTQNSTITVTDSVSRAIANADVDGKLIYPGDNYEKDFKGKTDSQGKFVYSWTIGRKGDVGALTVQVDVSSQAYIPSSATGSFDIVDSVAASGINNVLGDTLDNKSEIDFVIAGDYGCDSKTRQTIKSMEKLNPNLVFALGDLSEVKNTNCFFDIISELHDDDKVKIALGEDDTDSNKRYGDFLEHFDLESPFYSFDYQNVHFLAMSTGKNSLIPYGNGSAQYKFINDDLRKAANNSDIDWIIVYGYRPFYTSPTIHPSTEILRQTYPPLFEKYGVDLVISSHNHNYQRSYPLVYNIEETRQPIIKDVNASRYYMPGVPIYVVVGTAGNNLYDFRGQAPFMVTQVQESGFLHVNISNTNQHMLTGTFYNIGTGNYDDKFMIIKSEFE
ncbi:MAG TPA: metallophosphoesterase [Nitrososphaeraceae archaeon]|nr:metallophosphoesterase [Nitrososphaeraceae archaeon]